MCIFETAASFFTLYANFMIVQEEDNIKHTSVQLSVAQHRDVLDLQSQSLDFSPEEQGYHSLTIRPKAKDHFVLRPGRAEKRKRSSFSI